MSAILEKIFTGNARQEVETTFGASIDQLSALKELRLPPQIHEVLVESVNRTHSDRHEYWANFRPNKSGMPNTIELGQGTIFNAQDNCATSFDYKPLDSLRRIYLSHPVTVAFHTHPDITPEYLDSIGVVKSTSMYGDLDLAQTASILRFQIPNFSNTDLKVLETAGRYVRSALLGTAHGNRLLINPNFQLPLAVNDKNSKQYGRGVLEVALSRIRELKTQTLQPNSFSDDQAMDLLLHTFCQKTGFLAFTNDDFENPTLKRLSL